MSREEAAWRTCVWGRPGRGGRAPAALWQGSSKNTQLTLHSWCPLGPGNPEELAALLAREPALLPPHAWLAGHASVSPAQRAELAAWLRAAGAALGCSLAVVEHAAALLDRFLAAQRFQVREGAHVCKVQAEVGRG